MKIEIRTLRTGLTFGLTGATFALPVVGFLSFLPFAFIAFDITVTNETGEPVPLLWAIMLGSALYLPAALLLGILAGLLHRVTRSNLYTMLLSFGSLSFAAFVQPFYPLGEINTVDNLSLVQHQATALGWGLLFQCLATGTLYARRALPIGTYQVGIGVIWGLAGAFFASVVLDFILIYASFVHQFWPIWLILGVQAGLLNRITKSNPLTVLLSFVSIWFGALPLGFVKYVSDMETIGIGADVIATIGQGMLFQWIVVGVLHAVCMFRNSVWKR